MPIGTETQALREGRDYALKPLRTAVESPDAVKIGRDLDVIVTPHAGVRSPYGLSCVESCFSCKLRYDNYFCAALSQDSLVAFNQIKHAAVFPKGAVIFLEGQTPRGIFLLAQGQAKLSITSRFLDRFGLGPGRGCPWCGVIGPR